jgi:hypothetical protein
MQSPQSELSVCGFILNNKGEDGLAELRRNGVHMLAVDLFDIRQPDILYRCKGGCFLGWGGQRDAQLGLVDWISINEFRFDRHQR